MKDEPALPFDKERVANCAVGADFLGQLVRSKLFDERNPVMPPSDVFEWYALDVVYRFVGEEYIWVVLLEQSSEGSADVQNTLVELRMVLDLLAKNNQLGLQNKIREVLRIRKLQLPLEYDADYLGVL